MVSLNGRRTSDAGDRGASPDTLKRSYDRKTTIGIKSACNVTVSSNWVNQNRASLHERHRANAARGKKSV
jgi:hypothetical protein